MADVRGRTPWVFPFIERFPPFSVRFGSLHVSYVPTKIGATEEPLEDMREPRLNGFSPLQLYQAFKDAEGPTLVAAVK